MSHRTPPPAPRRPRNMQRRDKLYRRQRQALLNLLGIQRQAA